MPEEDAAGALELLPEVEEVPAPLSEEDDDPPLSPDFSEPLDSPDFSAPLESPPPSAEFEPGALLLFDG